jgi:hypothetical protein
VVRQLERKQSGMALVYSMKLWLYIPLLIISFLIFAFLGGMFVKTQVVLNDCMAQCNALILNISGEQPGRYQPYINVSEVIQNDNKYRENQNLT